MAGKSKMMYGSICVSDIDKKRLEKSQKNGKLYLPIVVWLNEEPDQYGNSASIQMGQTKEERARKEKAKYIGNLKMNDTSPVPAKEEDFQDLPF